MTRGGKRGGAGRPIGTAKPKNKNFQARVTAEEFLKLKEYLRELRA